MSEETPKRPYHKKRDPVAAQRIETNAGPIRKGNRRPFKKCTEEERDHRISAIADFIAGKLYSDWYIKRWIMKQWPLAYGAATIYVTRARKEIRRRSSLGKIETKDLVVPYLQRVIAQAPHTGKGVRAGVRASEVLVAIAGANAPVRIETSGPAGGPVKVEDVTPRGTIAPERLRELIAQTNAEAAKESK